jgi:hypothetical protein
VYNLSVKLTPEERKVISRMGVEGGKATRVYQPCTYYATGKHNFERNDRCPCGQRRKQTSEVKAEAARKNGALGGRPPEKSPSKAALYKRAQRERDRLK